MKNITNLLFLLILCIYISCNMIDYHPYDVNINHPRNINNTNISTIESRCFNKDTIRIVAMGDSQGFYNETRDFVKHINSRNDIDFVIHGGDFTDYGTTNEFLWQRDIFSKLDIPYVALIGNHDCLGTGRDAFKTIWGDTDFSFIVGDVKIICLNTNALEYDYSEAIPDFNFLSKQITDTSSQAKRTIVCMHAPPYSDVFNNNVAQPFQYYLNQLKGLMFCFNAHQHKIATKDIFNDGIIYYQCDCMEGRSYLLFTITTDGYEYESCYF